MIFFGKNKESKTEKPEEIKYTEVDLTDIQDPIFKAKKVFDSIIPGLADHLNKVDVAVGMALTLNDLANDLEELEPGFKQELINCFKKY